MTTLLAHHITLDERAARLEMRRQIARLERRLASYPVVPVPPAGSAAPDHPRLPGLAELEAERDRLVDRLASARERERQAEARFAAARRRVEAMLADPAAHRFERVTRAELGEPGCGAWHVRPRLGLIGMMLGWWRMTLSSGCP